MPRNVFIATWSILFLPLAFFFVFLFSAELAIGDEPILEVRPVSPGRLTQELVAFYLVILQVGPDADDLEVGVGSDDGGGELVQGTLTLILKGRYQYGWPPRPYWSRLRCFEIGKNCFMQWCSWFQTTLDGPDEKASHSPFLSLSPSVVV